MSTRKELLANVSRVVVKVGTNLIIGKDATENKTWLLHLVKDVVELRRRGLEVVLVSSGAIGAGMHLLGIKKRPQFLPMQQACAAVGQNQLMQLYERLFRRHKIKVAQVLLTIDDLKNRRRYLNLRHTMQSLLSMGVVPIVNENDSIAVDEIKVGDNDTLSAHVTNTVEADLLVILTDIDGLYGGNPKRDADARIFYRINRITPKIRSYCTGKGSEASIGGMQTKLAAAEIVMRSGEMALVANGYKERLPKLLAGKRSGTLFLPMEKGLSSRKRWIAFTQTVRGTLFIDPGGVSALRKRGKSLLAVGIRRIHGQFGKGDIVEVKTLRNARIARGITNYSSRQIDQIKGRKSSEIAAILGRRDYEEVIHCDNMVLMPK